MQVRNKVDCHSSLRSVVLISKLLVISLEPFRYRSMLKLARKWVFHSPKPLMAGDASTVCLYWCVNQALCLCV